MVPHAYGTSEQRALSDGSRDMSKELPASSTSQLSSSRSSSSDQRLFDSTDSWSRHSRYVLTSSKDWNVVVWDLASETDPPRRVTTIRFDAPVSSASFHPRNRYAFIFFVR